MKKFISTCLACTCLIIASFGQVDIGVKFGLNFANVNNMNSYSGLNRLGYNTGVVTRINISKQFKLQPELLYSAKGFRYHPYSYPGSGTDLGSIRLNYLSLPVLGSFSVGQGFSLLFGPEFDMLLHANSVLHPYEGNVTKYYNHFGVGFDAGVSYRLVGGLGVEARYNYGLSHVANIPIYDSGGSVIGRDRSGHNSVFQLGVYFKFPK